MYAIIARLIKYYEYMVYVLLVFYIIGAMGSIGRVLWFRLASWLGLDYTGMYTSIHQLIRH